MKTLKMVEIVKADSLHLAAIAEHIKEYLHDSAVLFSYESFDEGQFLRNLVGEAKLTAHKCVESVHGTHREQFSALYDAFCESDARQPLCHIVLMVPPEKFQTFTPYMAGRMNVSILEPLPKDAVIVRFKRHDEAIVLLTEDLFQFSVSPEE